MSINGSISNYSHNRSNHTFKYILTCRTATYYVNSISRDHVSTTGLQRAAFCICSQSQSKASTVTRHLLCSIGSKLAAEEKAI